METTSIPCEKAEVVIEEQEEKQEEKITCYSCAEEITKGDEKEHDGDNYCDSCFNDKFGECENCNCFVRVDLLGSAYNSRNRDISICESCKDDDFFECSDCNNNYPNDTSITISRHNAVCNGCYNDNYFTCDDCDNVFHNDNYGDNGCCETCSEKEDDSIIKSYEFRIPIRLIGKESKFYYGVELEVEVDKNKDEKAQDILDIFNEKEDFLYIKHDGSLDDGFELVSQPANLEIHKKRWKPFFENVPSGLSSFNTKTCGLHIHCSRKPLSSLTIGKILVFVNSRENHDFIQCIAGRPFGHWAKFKNKTIKDGNKFPDERYEAVNLMNKETIEFRIFKGTLKEASFYKAIEFCDALIHFCSPKDNLETSNIVGLSKWLNFINDSDKYAERNRLTASFCEFVEKRKNEYPCLWGFLSAKWLKKETKESKKYGYAVPVEAE